MSFAVIILCVASQRVFIVVSVYFFYRLSPENFGYTLVSMHESVLKCLWCWFDENGAGSCLVAVCGANSVEPYGSGSKECGAC
jgi:hypothetical protein